MFFINIFLGSCLCVSFVYVERIGSPQQKNKNKNWKKKERKRKLARGLPSISFLSLSLSLLNLSAVCSPDLASRRVPHSWVTAWGSKIIAQISTHPHQSANYHTASSTPSFTGNIIEYSNVSIPRYINMSVDANKSQIKKNTYRNILQLNSSH